MIGKWSECGCVEMRDDITKECVDRKCVRPIMIMTVVVIVNSR